MRRTASRRSSSERSQRMALNPESAATWAIPRPMVPAPTTPMVSTLEVLGSCRARPDALSGNDRIFRNLLPVGDPILHLQSPGDCVVADFRRESFADIVVVAFFEAELAVPLVLARAGPAEEG